MFFILLIGLLFCCNVDALSLLQDPPVLSPWIVRDSNTYQVMVNDTETGIVSVSKNVSIDIVHQRIAELVGSERYERDTKLLQNWSVSLNTSHQADIHANASQSLKLNSFYLHHAQCRRCVGYNLGLLDAASASASSVDVVVDVPHYAPARIMKWCSLAWSTTQSDDEGYCIDADDQCPDSTIDQSVLDVTKCHNDAARDKRSCELCVTSWTATMVIACHIIS